LLFGNIRTFHHTSLENSDTDWKVIIDFPFDEQGHTPDEDQRTLRQFLDQKRDGARTLCWMPSFLGEEALRELGTLVRLRNIFTTIERFESLAGHLSPQDRLAAKEQLENQRQVLEARVKLHLEAAYGLGKPEKGILDSNATLEPADQFQSLYPGFKTQVPSAANLGGALISLLIQVMEFEFPAAPDFKSEAKPSVMKKVYELVQPATQRPDGRQQIEKTDRKLLHDIANPLKLGEMNLDSNVFVLGDHWRNHFERRITPGVSPSVAELRRWIDEPKRMGLETDTQNLIIRLFAEQTNRVLARHGAPFEVDGLRALPDDCVLQSFPLPTPELWEKAQKRAGAIFGLNADRQTAGLTSRAVANLRSQLRTRALNKLEGCRKYLAELRLRLANMTGEQLPADIRQWPARLQTAQATTQLCQDLGSHGEEEALEVICRAGIATSETEMGSCISKAADWASLMEGISWELIEAVGRLQDHRQGAGQRIFTQACDALKSDNLSVDLQSTMQAAQRAATQLLTVAPPSPQPVPPAPPPPPEVTPPPTVSPPVTPPPVGVKRGRQENLSGGTVVQFVEDLRRKVPPGGILRVTIDWEIEGGNQ
jgi:hypothetical protein